MSLLWGTSIPLNILYRESIVAMEGFNLCLKIEFTVRSSISNVSSDDKNHA